MKLIKHMTQTTYMSTFSKTKKVPNNNSCVDERKSMAISQISWQMCSMCLPNCGELHCSFHLPGTETEYADKAGKLEHFTI